MWRAIKCWLHDLCVCVCVCASVPHDLCVAHGLVDAREGAHGLLHHLLAHTQHVVLFKELIWELRHAQAGINLLQGGTHTAEVRARHRRKEKISILGKNRLCLQDLFLILMARLSISIVYVKHKLLCESRVYSLACVILQQSLLNVTLKST